MKEFWINNGWYFIYVEGLIVILTFFSSPFYTGTVKKLDLMITDIKEKGEIAFNTLYFDKFLRNKNLDPFRMSSITHLYFNIPDKNRNPRLYGNADFKKQLKKVLAYRKIYKYIFILGLVDLLVIITLTYFYGQNIK